MGPRSRALVRLVIVSALIVFAGLAQHLARGGTFDFDVGLRAAVQSWASPVLTAAMLVVTYLGSEFVLVPLGLIVVWRWAVTGGKRAALRFAAACLGAELLTQILKLLFRRPRPHVFFGLAPVETYSFPSGHTFVSTMFYVVLAATLAAGVASRSRRAVLGAAAVLLSLAIGFSRIYLGFHYPSDVLAGYAAAAVCLPPILSARLPERRSH